MQAAFPRSGPSAVDTAAVTKAAGSSRRLDLVDAAVALAIALCIGVAAWLLHRSMDPRFFAIPAGNDVWFEGDLPTVADSMLHRWSDQSRNARHPLFPAVTTLPLYAIRTLGLGPAAALALLIGLGAAAWSVAFYVVARLITARRMDAVVFTTLACATSGTIFWVAMPETYVWSSLSVLLALGLCAGDPGGRRAEGWYVAAAALSLGVTLSNWIAGILVAASRHRWRRALQIAANSLCVVVVLWGLQRMIFPTAPFFIGHLGSARFIAPAASGGPGADARALLFHSAVMPAIEVVREPKWGPIMSVQRSSIGSSGPWGILATALWVGLLGFAVRGLLAGGADGGFRVALAGTLAAQLGLYMIYGEETFLYSLHVEPLLVLAAALATLTAERRIVLGLAAAFIVAATVNNIQQLEKAMTFFQSFAR